MFEDADGDLIANWQDEFPNDTFNNNPDFDGDGILNGNDPYPKDSGNFSSVNNTAWGPGVLADDDSDGTPNWNDTTPYSVDTDADDDGIDDSFDPYPNDSSNFSSVNNLSWGSNVLGDNDQDGVPNWNDADPLDSDGDGLSDGVDPFVSDAANYSAINVSYWWYNTALGDNDSDGTLNWQDAWPYDANNGYYPPQDSDGDGIPDSSDAWPYDANNGYYPPQDSDSDGIPDSDDPAPWDSSNYSPYNGGWWYGSALSDNDGDNVNNWQDAWPYDANNGQQQDSDGDGYYDSGDPAPSDWSNYSSHNWQHWYSNALGDNDNDGTANFYDYQPNGDSNVDSDGDGYYDSNDPAPNDSSNYSSTNGQWWYGSALNDNDADGSANFYDDYPYGPPPPPDSDGDGLDANAEVTHGTSDSDVDSDDDGLSDGEEVNIFGTSPVNAHHRQPAAFQQQSLHRLAARRSPRHRRR
jgi:hypothetical protein